LAPCLPGHAPPNTMKATPITTTIAVIYRFQRRPFRQDRPSRVDDDHNPYQCRVWQRLWSNFRVMAPYTKKLKAAHS
jgi:hypothetical protein